MSSNILIDHQDAAIISSKIAQISSPKMSNTLQKLTNQLQAIGLKQHDEQATSSSDNAGAQTTGSSKKRRSRQSNRSLSIISSPSTDGNHHQRQQLNQERSDSLVRQKNVRFSLSNSTLSLPSTVSNSATIQRIFTNTGFNNRLRHRSNSESHLSSNDSVVVNMPQRNHRQQQRSMMNTKPGTSNDFVSREIMDYYQRNRQSSDKYKAKQILRESLENTFKQIINLHIIGSSTNGIGDNASTVDICVMAHKKSILPAHSEQVPVPNSKNEKKPTEKSPKKPVEQVDEKIVHAAADSNTDGGDDTNENDNDDSGNVIGNEDLALKHIEKILQSKNFAQNIVLIPARVPIIKFKDNICNMNVTLNLNQEVSIRNTQLIRDYSKMDWRFPQLAMIIKEWARENRINSAVEKSISPYSWTLMVIHYLQAVEPPVLPCLQKMSPQRYDIDINMDDERNVWRQAPVKWQSKNNNSLKQLMKGFFRYFGYVYRYDQHIMSIREGKVLNRIYHRSSNGVGTDENAVIQWNSLMCVEEPFNRSNTTRCVKDYATFERVKELLRMSSNALKGNRISLFNIIVDDMDFPNKY
ncbi:Zinc finger, CCHC domain-containing protein [Dermatophagoides farinae]|uniref:Zinc finger, CCHC domain-containing protein n=1 Tax=Dermatophagoides farinae TaxID=6954 RepID=A0A922L1M5_DERFA|nr:Zinc finger, CCHC domain-containing protein [Dermatophagoides farinae]